MFKIQILTIIVLTATRLSSSYEELLGLPDEYDEENNRLADVWDIKETDIWGENIKIANSEPEASQVAVKEICEKYDIMVNDVLIDCNKFKLKRKTEKAEHVLRKRETNHEETLEEGSGNGDEHPAAENYHAEHGKAIEEKTTEIILHEHVATEHSEHVENVFVHQSANVVDEHAPDAEKGDHSTHVEKNAELKLTPEEKQSEGKSQEGNSTEQTVHHGNNQEIHSKEDPAGEKSSDITLTTTQNISEEQTVEIRSEITGATDKPKEGATGVTEKPTEGTIGVTDKSIEGTTGTAEKPKEKETTGTTDKPKEEETTGTTETPKEETTTEIKTTEEKPEAEPTEKTHLEETAPKNETTVLTLTTPAVTKPEGEQLETVDQSTESETKSENGKIPIKISLEGPSENKAPSTSEPVASKETQEEKGKDNEVKSDNVGIKETEPKNDDVSKGGDKKGRKLIASGETPENGNDPSEKNETPEVGEAKASVSEKDRKILLGVFGAVVGMGAAAFTYNYIRKRRITNARRSSSNGVTSNDPEEGREMKPLMKNGSDKKQTVEYSDEKQNKTEEVES